MFKCKHLKGKSWIIKEREIITNDMSWGSWEVRGSKIEAQIEGLGLDRMKDYSFERGSAEERMNIDIWFAR